MSKDIVGTLKAKLSTSQARVAELTTNLEATTARLEKTTGALTGVRIAGQELKDILAERNVDLTQLTGYNVRLKKEIADLKYKVAYETSRMSAEAKGANKAASRYLSKAAELKKTADLRLDALERSNKRLSVATYVAVVAVVVAACAASVALLGV